MKKFTFSSNLYHIAKWLRMKPMRWEFFMGYRCYSPNTWVMWTYPKSALSPISCVQTVACSIKNHKPWECKNLMQVSFKWLLEPHEIGVWHLQRAKTILYSWDGKSKKLDPPTTPISSVPSIYIYIYVYTYNTQNYTDICTSTKHMRMTNYWGNRQGANLGSSAIEVSYNGGTPIAGWVDNGKSG